jgi:hypothetical protein
MVRGMVSWVLRMVDIWIRRVVRMRVRVLVVGNEGLRYALADGIDLGSVATTGNADADVDVGELVEAENEEGLVDLEAEDLGLNKVERAAVDLDQTLAGLA